VLQVEHKKLRLGRFTEVDRYRLISKGVILKAMPARSPKVTVTDAYLKPLAGAKVFVETDYGLKSVESAVGLTNSKGELVVPAVYHGGKYTFRAALLGYCPKGSGAAPVGSQNWVDSIEIVTEPATAVVKGKVVDKAGKPVVGAKVTTDFGPYALTDASGEFTLSQMPDGIVRLEARKGKLAGTNIDVKGRLMRQAAIVIR
jgi:hypothetical protein